MNRIYLPALLLVPSLLSGCQQAVSTGFDLQFRNVSGADLDYVVLESDDGEIAAGVLSDSISKVQHINAPLGGKLTLTWKDADNNKHAVPFELPSEAYDGRAVIINFIADSEIEINVDDEVLVD